MRKDIEEGSLFSEMPIFGYGRVKSRPDLREWYMTASFGRRFMGSMKYRIFVASLVVDGKRKFRHWFCKHGVAVNGS